MFVVAACKEEPRDPTPPVIDEPDAPRVKEDPCNKGYTRPGEENVRCK